MNRHYDFGKKTAGDSDTSYNEELETEVCSTNVKFTKDGMPAEESNEEKTLNHSDLQLEKVIVEFSQEGNTHGTTEEYEDLTVDINRVAGADKPDDYYYVFRSKSGWSVNDARDMIRITNAIDEAVRLMRYVIGEK